MAHILESELNEFKEEWNTHSLRANSKTLLPSGIPNDLNDMPETYGKLILCNINYNTCRYALLLTC